MKAGLGDESLVFFDPAGSGPVTYGDLRRRVAAPNFIVPARLRAAGAAEAILGLLSALLLNAELTLLDFDTLSTDSRSPLAPGPELIGGREALAGRAYGSANRCRPHRCPCGRSPIANRWRSPPSPSDPP